MNSSGLRGVVLAALLPLGCTAPDTSSQAPLTSVAEQGPRPATVPADSARFLVEKGGMYGYIDKSGRIVIEPRYTVAFEFRENRALFGRDWSAAYGFLDPDGREVVPMQFRSSAWFSDGVALVEINPSGEWGQGRLGFIDHAGTWVIPPTGTVFRWASDFSEGLALATAGERARGEKLGFIDKRGAWAIAPQFDRAEPFSEGLAAVGIGGKRGFIDAQSRFVIPPVFVQAQSFAGGLALVHRESGKPLFIDRSGTTVIDVRFEYASGFRDRWSLVRVDGKYGYINKTGAFVIAPGYVEAAPFAEDLAAVRIGNAWGFINRRAELVIPAKFEVTAGGPPGPFRSGLARVYSRVPGYSEPNAWPMAGLMFGYINVEGEYVWPPTR